MPRTPRRSGHRRHTHCRTKDTPASAPHHTERRTSHQASCRARSSHTQPRLKPRTSDPRPPSNEAQTRREQCAREPREGSRDIDVRSYPSGWCTKVDSVPTRLPRCEPGGSAQLSLAPCPAGKALDAPATLLASNVERAPLVVTLAPAALAHTKTDPGGTCPPDLAGGVRRRRIEVEAELRVQAGSPLGQRANPPRRRRNHSRTRRPTPSVCESDRRTPGYLASVVPVDGERAWTSRTARGSVSP